jgi:hypothetical protein
MKMSGRIKTELPGHFNKSKTMRYSFGEFMQIRGWNVLPDGNHGVAMVRLKGNVR